MPTYDYHCETCGLDFELQQEFSEDTLEKCPTKASGRSPNGCAKTGRGKVTKVFSAPGITFKGTGFYKNDSRSGSSKSNSTTASSSDSTTSSSSTSDSSTSASSSDSSKSSSSSSSSSSGDSAKKKSSSSGDAAKKSSSSSD